MIHRGTVRLRALAPAVALAAAASLAQAAPALPFQPSVSKAEETGAAVLAAAAQARDPFTGAWLLDPGARPGGVARQVLTISVRGEEETYRSELTTTDGRRQVTDYVARYDGAEYPSVTRLTGGGKPDESRSGGVILRRTDELTRERYWKQDGRVFRILRRTVSANGCAMSSLLIDVAPDGAERAGGVLRFTRQDPACEASGAKPAPAA